MTETGESQVATAKAVEVQGDDTLIQRYTFAKTITGLPGPATYEWHSTREAAERVAIGEVVQTSPFPMSIFRARVA